MINTIIFDLDGTLLNTLEDLHDSTNFILDYCNYPKKSLEEIRNFVGNGIEKLIERALPNGINNQNFTKCVTKFKKHYSENMYNKTKPYEGIIEMLTALNTHNVRIAVVSNKFDKAAKELCKKYFNDKIDIVVGESKDIRKKPAPDSILEVLKQLGSETTTTLYVGDSEIDIEAAKNANLPCICVSWGFRNTEFLRRAGAKIIIDKPSQLLDLIDIKN